MTRFVVSVLFSGILLAACSDSDGSSTGPSSSTSSSSGAESGGTSSSNTSSSGSTTSSGVTEISCNPPQEVPAGKIVKCAAGCQQAGLNGKAYCTKSCSASAPCPTGFDCNPVNVCEPQ